MSGDPKRSLDLELWIDEESEHRRISGRRANGMWFVKLLTHGAVAPGLLYVEGRGRSLADAIEDALDVLERELRERKPEAVSA